MLIHTGKVSLGCDQRRSREEEEKKEEKEGGGEGGEEGQDLGNPDPPRRPGLWVSNGSFLCNNFGFLLPREVIKRQIFHSLFQMDCTDQRYMLRIHLLSCDVVEKTI